MGKQKKARKYTITKKVDFITDYNSSMNDSVLPKSIAQQMEHNIKRRNDLAALKVYMAENRSKLIGLLPQGETLRSLTIKINNKIADLVGQYNELDIKLEANKRAAQRDARMAASGSAGDGQCYIEFVNVGMGDCTLITTPEGRFIMIDFGTTGTADVVGDGSMVDPEEQILQTVNSHTFLDNDKDLDILFLTHPDADHINRFTKLTCGIDYIYYGGAKTYSPYNKSTFLNTVLATKKRVTLAESKTTKTLEHQLNDQDIDNRIPKPGKLGYEYIDIDNKINVYYEKTGFKISLLAGNNYGIYDKDGDWETTGSKLKNPAEDVIDATSTNVGSLVILVECFKEKIIIAGDSTIMAETFLQRYFENILNNVTTLRVAHHGSNTSSSQNFVKCLTSLKTAVISTGGRKTRKHFLPKKFIVEKYIAGKKIGDDPAGHTIYCFDDTQRDQIQCFKTVYATGSNDTKSLHLKVSETHSELYYK